MQINTQLPTLEQVRHEIELRRLEGDLLYFIKWYFKEIKGENFRSHWFHEKICEKLMQVYDGDIQNLIINIPPRFGKTELVVKGFMAWALAKNAKSKFIHLSYSDDLALDNSAAVKDVVVSDPFQSFWDLKLRQDSKSKKKWFNSAGGGIYATSTGGQITGFGAGSVESGFNGCIILDDPQKPEDAKSETLRRTVNERFNTTIKTRLNNPLETPIIVIMQRVHEDDLTGFLLGGGSGLEFEHLSLPALKELAKTEDDPREQGESLWAEKFSPGALKRMQQSDPMTFSGQYQQTPTPASGGLIKKEWFNFYNPNDLEFENITISVDATFKGGATSDFVVIQVWEQQGANHYLINQVRKKLTFTQTLKELIRISKEFSNYKELLIEEKANGAAIIDVLKNELHAIIPINPKESKEARLHACAGFFEAGNVFIPDNIWINEFISEFLFFPNGKNDDQIDAATQYLNRVRSSKVDTFKNSAHDFNTITGNLGAW